jgi:transcriptional regulator with XRE-family HTH domain
LSCTEVAKKLGMSQSKISRLETGMSGLQIDDVAAILGLYEVPADRRSELLDMLRRSDEKGWWERQGAGLPSLWKTLIDFENRATRIQTYQPLLIHGLLQTPEYCQAVIQGSNPALTESELETLVATRMARQTLLGKRTGPQFYAVLDEGVLRRPIGGSGVMRRQMQHLLQEAERPNITVRVAPIAAGAHAGLRGPFTILEFDAEAHIVHVENQCVGLFLEEAPDLQGYRLALSNILNVALAPAASAEFLAAVAADLA